ncbi:MAG: TonB-dependent receptor [Pseudomonadota bacterium]
MIRMTLAVSLGAVMASGALAQDASSADAEDEARLGTIIVQGTKFEQSLMETPDSVSVVTAEEIEREPVADLYDIIERIPNVTAAFGEQGFAIRGVDQRGVGGGGSGLTITTYVDDAPLGNQTTFFGPTGSWDVSQIEVFRGPQSTNFGRNALAGAIYIRTRDPEFEPDFRARVEIAEADTYQVSAAGGTAIIDDKLAFRLSGDYRESKGFITNTFLNEDADTSELSNIRGKLLFTPTENIRIVTTHTYAENFAGEDVINVGETDTFSRDVAYNIPGREGTETFLNAVNLEWDISETWSFQSITTHQSTDYIRLEDFNTEPGDTSEVGLDRRGTDEALSQEVRLKYAGDRLNALVGLYYVDTEDSFDDDFIVAGAALSPLLAGTGLNIGRDSLFESEAMNYAIFVDGEYQVSDQLSLLFGARVDHEETSQDSTADTRFIPGIPPGFEALLGPFEGTTTASTEADFDAFLPKLGVQYAVADHTNLAFVVQQGYRAGGSELSVLDGRTIDYDPEFLTNYEFSTRSTLLDGDLTINSNIFYADWQDQQVPEPIVLADGTTSTLTRTVNAGESTLMGFEIDADYAVDSTLDIYGSLGYVKTEFEDFVTSQFDYTGNSFAFAPEWSYNVGFNKIHDVGIFYGLDVSYRDDVFSDNENEDVVEAYTLVNARVGYEFNDYSRITVYARNLFDEDYYTFLNRDFDASGNFLSGTSRIGDPRVVGVRLEANF